MSNRLPDKDDWLESPAPDYLKFNDKGQIFQHIPEPKKMQCNKCNLEKDDLIPVYRFAPYTPFFNYNIRFLCKECFKDFLLER